MSYVPPSHADMLYKYQKCSAPYEFSKHTLKATCLFSSQSEFKQQPQLNQIQLTKENLRSLTFRQPCVISDVHYK